MNMIKKIAMIFAMIVMVVDSSAVIQEGGVVRRGREFTEKELKARVLTYLRDRNPMTQRAVFEYIKYLSDKVTVPQERARLCMYEVFNERLVGRSFLFSVERLREYAREADIDDELFDFEVTLPRLRMNNQEGEQKIRAMEVILDRMEDLRNQGRLHIRFD